MGRDWRGGSGPESEHNVADVCGSGLNDAGNLRTEKNRIDEQLPDMRCLKCGRDWWTQVIAGHIADVELVKRPHRSMLCMGVISSRSGSNSCIERPSLRLSASVRTTSHNNSSM